MAVKQGLGAIISLLMIQTALVVLHTTAAQKVKFPKDQRMDVPFPPGISVSKSPGGLPAGHLRPLGHQKRSSAKVQESLVKTDYLSGEVKVVRGAYEYNTHIWTSVLEQHGDRSVNATQKLASGVPLTTSMLLSEFLNQYDSEEWFLSEAVPCSALKEIKLPKGSECLRHQLLFAHGGLSSGATTDFLRLSSLNQLTCLISGKRDYMIISPESSLKVPHLHQIGYGICNISMVVAVNPDMINVFDFPWISGLQWNYTSLLPSDCIYIPSGYLTQTSSYGNCESVTFYWSNAQGHHCNVEEVADNLVAPALCSESDGHLVFNTEVASPTSLHILLKHLVNHKRTISRDCWKEVAEKLLHSKVPAEDLYEMLDSKELLMDVNHTDIERALAAVIEASRGEGHAHDEL